MPDISIVITTGIVAQTGYGSGGGSLMVVCLVGFVGRWV